MCLVKRVDPNIGCSEFMYELNGVVDVEDELVNMGGSISRGLDGR